jgi:hypothetical protein
MAKTGRPISDAERRARSWDHLMQYSIKMTVRRDVGGSDDIENHPEMLGRELVGKTAAEAGDLVAAKLLAQKNGIRERQRRTIEEFDRRTDKVTTALGRASILAKSGHPKEAHKILDAAITDMLFGEPLVETPTPQTHVLV